MYDLQELKIAVGRMLLQIEAATAPLSMETLAAAIEEEYEKRHDPQTLTDSWTYLLRQGWITQELTVTPAGTLVAIRLRENKEGWAEKFFRKSNSPNVGPRAPQRQFRGNPPQHKPNPNLTVAR